MTRTAWRPFGAGYLGLLLLAVLPLLLITYLPLDDYHNHLARMHILASGQDDPYLSTFYRTNWQILPNLAMDLVVPWLARIMPLEHAGRLFVGLVFVLITTGTVALHAALHRELSWWPLLAFLFLYNRILLFGFINYLAGVGLFLWTLAGWIHWQQRPAAFRLAVFSGLSTCLFFAHLYALGLYALCVAGLELGQVAGRAGGLRALLRRLPVTLGQFAAPALLFMARSPTAADGGTFDYFELGFHFWNKVRAAHQVLLSYHPPLDRLTFVALAVALIAALALRWVELDRRMRAPLILLVLVFLALPQALMGGLLVDFRLPAAMVFVLVASLRPRPAALPVARAVAVALAALFALRMGLIAERWHAFDKVYDRVLEAIAELPPGRRIVAAGATRPAAREASAPTMMYIGALAVIHRSAFDPAVFVNPGQQPIVAKGRYRELAEAQWWPSPPIPLEQLAPSFLEGADAGVAARRTEDPILQYDYLILLYPQSAANPLPRLLEPLQVDEQFHVYRIRQPQTAGSGARAASGGAPGEG
jgi:hypothetical protein